MKRYKELFKLLVELVAVYWGLYQLSRYDVSENPFYGLFLALWLFYLFYELYVKLRYRAVSANGPSNELRLKHVDDKKFCWSYRVAAVLVLVALVLVLVYRWRSLEGAEWVFIFSILLYSAYACIHIPTIWLEVEGGYLKGGQLKEKIQIATIDHVVLHDNQIDLVRRDDLVRKVAYVRMNLQEKNRAVAFFEQYLGESQSRVKLA